MFGPEITSLLKKIIPLTVLLKKLNAKVAINDS